MADPLSIAASVATLVGVCSAVGKRLLKLIKQINHAPEELIALSNETHALGSTLDHAKYVYEQMQGDAIQSPSAMNETKKLLSEAGGCLEELNRLLEKTSNHKLSDRVKWLQTSKHAERLVKKLQGTRSLLLQNITLSTSVATARIPSMELRIESLLTMVSQMMASPNETSNPNDTSPTIAGSLPAPEAALLDTIADSNSVASVHIRTTVRCERSCGCRCHATRRYHTPPFVENFLGSLLLGYSGPPLLCGKCVLSTCKRYAHSFDAVYCFPQWFLARSIRIAASATFSGSFTLCLNVRKRVAWGQDNNILRFALTGNTVGVQSLLASGKASLIDVDPNHGRTPLHYAVQHNELRVCEVLLHAGADPHYQDDSGMSAFQRAWEHVLCKRGTARDLSDLQRLFPTNDGLELWGFSHIHKTVLTLLPARLDLELEKPQYYGQVNALDTHCRTPLHWATIRNDEASVRSLLRSGANIDTCDYDGRTPLSHAASSGSVSILELLLSRGADVNAKDRKGSQAIHYGSRHQSAAKPVKMLLKAGASVDESNKLGHTPLIGAAITNRLEIGALLIEHGANVNVSSIHGDSVLFETIIHNNHEFLQMLLQKGADLTHTNNSGSTILHTAAMESDSRTVEILNAARPLGINCCATDSNGNTAREVLQLRIAAPEGFKDDFEQLLSN